MSYNHRSRQNPVKHLSTNSENALHLNKIENRSLDLTLDRITKENLFQFKDKLKNFKIIEQDKTNLQISTGNVKSQIFSKSKFAPLMVPIKREPLPTEEIKVVIAPVVRQMTTISDLEEDSFQSETPIDLEPVLTKDPKQIRLEKIEVLKKKDPIFRKRMDQFAIYKNIKKAPQFDDEKKVSDINIPETLKNRDKREIMNIVEEHRNYRPNPYTSQQLRLDRAVQEFCEEQMKNTHIYEGMLGLKTDLLWFGNFL